LKVEKKIWEQWRAVDGDWPTEVRFLRAAGDGFRRPRPSSPLRGCENLEIQGILVNHNRNPFHRTFGGEVSATK
jgi:hypothetical protein